MAITVVIQRKAKHGHYDEMVDLQTVLRAKALHQPGYISGLTLHSSHSPGTCLLLSRWRNPQDWLEWEASPARKEIVAKIEPLLSAPAIAEMYFETPARLGEGV